MINISADTFFDSLSIHPDNISAQHPFVILANWFRSMAFLLTAHFLIGIAQLQLLVRLGMELLYKVLTMPALNAK